MLDSILETKIFKNPNHIDTLIEFLTEKKNESAEVLDNKSQIDNILKPALTKFITEVVKVNVNLRDESTVIRAVIPLLSTETIINKLFNSNRNVKILEKAPPNKLIETFIKDLRTLTMDILDTDKERAKEEAKKFVFPKDPKAHKESKIENTPTKPTTLTKTNSWLENPMAAGGKSKTRRLVNRRKKRKTYKI